MKDDDQRIGAPSQQADAIFFDALGYDEVEQKAFVGKACKGNDVLLDEVNSLLTSLAAVDDFLEDGSSLSISAQDLYDILSKLP
jgi:hypothetical protein